MNKGRRKLIADIIARAEAIKVDLEIIRDDEQNYYDAMPEGPQADERGEKAQAAIDALDEAGDDIDSIIDKLNSAAE